MKDLYITIDGEPIGLREFDSQIAQSIKTNMEAGCVVFEVSQSAWSGAANNLPNGIQAVYVSGSHPKIPIKPDSEVTVAGEVALFRVQNGQQKAYRNLLVASGSNRWFYGSEFKDFPNHYYSGPHPTGSIWKKIHRDWPSP